MYAYNVSGYLEFHRIGAKQFIVQNGYHLHQENLVLINIEKEEKYVIFHI